MAIEINKEYLRDQLIKVDADPFVQFDLWFKQACQEMPSSLVNSMVLATVSLGNKPSARVVLLKEYNSEGFIFYTNYQSRKGTDIAANPNVSLLFWWEILERQVRIEGTVEKIAVEKSSEYFQSRPKSSQLAALASHQSQPLTNIKDLENKFESLCAQYAAAELEIPKPDYWGGYIVKPESWEFWQGRENRLHDRFRYLKNSDGKWDITRLYP